MIYWYHLVFYAQLGLRFLQCNIQLKKGKKWTEWNAKRRTETCHHEQNAKINYMKPQKYFHVLHFAMTLGLIRNQVLHFPCACQTCHLNTKNRKWEWIQLQIGRFFPYFCFFLLLHSLCSFALQMHLNVFTESFGHLSFLCFVTSDYVFQSEPSTCSSFLCNTLLLSSYSIRNMTNKLIQS